MIINQDLVKRIKDHFNLNIYETKVWLALLSKGVVSAGETAELSGVPRSRTYDVLESLAKRGFAIVKVGKPVRYIAVDPRTVVERMKSQVLSDAQDRVKRLASLKNTSEYEELEQLHKTGIIPIKPEDLSGHLKGRANVLSKMKELFDRAEKEVSIGMSVTDFESKSRVILPALDKLNKKKIKIKIALSGDMDKIKRINSRHKLKARISNNSGRFFISDKREALILINSENSDEEIEVWLNSPYFAASFSKMFDSQLRNG